MRRTTLCVRVRLAFFGSHTSNFSFSCATAHCGVRRANRTCPCDRTQNLKFPCKKSPVRRTTFVRSHKKVCDRTHTVRRTGLVRRTDCRAIGKPFRAAPHGQMCVARRKFRTCGSPCDLKFNDVRRARAATFSKVPHFRTLTVSESWVILRTA